MTSSWDHCQLQLTIHHRRSQYCSIDKHSLYNLGSITFAFTQSKLAGIRKFKSFAEYRHCLCILHSFWKLIPRKCCCNFKVVIIIGLSSWLWDDEQGLWGWPEGAGGLALPYKVTYVLWSSTSYRFIMVNVSTLYLGQYSTGSKWRLRSTGVICSVCVSWWWCELWQSVVSVGIS